MLLQPACTNKTLYAFQHLLNLEKPSLDTKQLSYIIHTNYFGKTSAQWYAICRSYAPIWPWVKPLNIQKASKIEHNRGAFSSPNRLLLTHSQYSLIFKSFPHTSGKHPNLINGWMPVWALQSLPAGHSKLCLPHLSDLPKSCPYERGQWNQRPRSPACKENLTPRKAVKRAPVTALSSPVLLYKPHDINLCGFAEHFCCREFVSFVFTLFTKLSVEEDWKGRSFMFTAPELFQSFAQTLPPTIS